MKRQWDVILNPQQIPIKQSLVTLNSLGNSRHSTPFAHQIPSYNIPVSKPQARHTADTQIDFPLTISYKSSTISKSDIKSNMNLPAQSDDVPVKPSVQPINNPTTLMSTPSKRQDSTSRIRFKLSTRTLNSLSTESAKQRNKSSNKSLLINNHNLQSTLIYTEQTQPLESVSSQISKTVPISNLIDVQQHPSTTEIVEIYPKRVRRKHLYSSVIKEIQKTEPLPLPEQKNNLIEYFKKAADSTSSLPTFDDYIKNFQTNYKRKIKKVVLRRASHQNQTTNQSNITECHSIPDRLQTLSSNKGSQAYLTPNTQTNRLNLNENQPFKIKITKRHPSAIDSQRRVRNQESFDIDVNSSQNNRSKNTKTECVPIRDPSAPGDTPKNKAQKLNDCTYYGTQFSQHALSPDRISNGSAQKSRLRLSSEHLKLNDILISKSKKNLFRDTESDSTSSSSSSVTQFRKNSNK